MSAFKTLRDISRDFENDLQRVSTELFTAKIGENFEDNIAKKLRDMTLFTSKLRLLRAKPLANNPQITEQVRNERTTLQEYEDTAISKVLEQQIVKFLTQSHAVKALITTPSRKLDPELVERKELDLAESLCRVGLATNTGKRGRPSSSYLQVEKEQKRRKGQVQSAPSKDVRLDQISHWAIWNEKQERKIITSLAEFRQQECQLRHLQTLLTEKETELSSVRVQWDTELGQLREMREGVDGTVEVDMGPLHKKLRTLVDKMELMRWLVSKLATCRTGSYDWLSDPHRRLKALNMARQAHTVEQFLESS